MEIKTGKFTDPRDGRVYKTVKINNQEWMAENLNVSKYCNGDPISNVEEEDKWGNNKAGAWCYYNNDPVNKEDYGKLYKWNAVNDPRGLPFKGWHIPSDDDWKELERNLGMSQRDADRIGWRGTDEGCKLKETGTLHWKEPNECATNQSSFNAVPGGYRDVSGDFYVITYSGYYWSITEQKPHFIWYRTLYHNSNKIHRKEGYEGDGFSVRCLRNI